MVLIFVASLNENVKLANRIKSSFDSKNIESKIVNLVELNLPLYDSLKEENSGIPKKVLETIETMKQANGYIFVSPEYNSCVTPVLLNFIAWVSRVGDNFRGIFSMKKIQLATFSGVRGQDSLNALRVQFTRLGSIVMPREILVTPQKELKDSSLENILSQFETFIKEKR